MNPATIKHDLDIDKLNETKKVIVDNIFNDEKLSIIEKLLLISQNHLLPYDPWINHGITWDHKTLFETQLKEKYPDKEFFIIDEVLIAERSKYYQINMADEVECILENAAWDLDETGMSNPTDEELMEYEVEILTCRGLEDTFKIKVGDYIQAIYDWVVKNRKIGFVVDW